MIFDTGRVAALSTSACWGFRVRVAGIKTSGTMPLQRSYQRLDDAPATLPQFAERIVSVFAPRERNPEAKPAPKPATRQ